VTPCAFDYTECTIDNKLLSDHTANSSATAAHCKSVLALPFTLQEGKSIFVCLLLNS